MTAWWAPWPFSNFFLGFPSSPCGAFTLNIYKRWCYYSRTSCYDRKKQLMGCHPCILFDGVCLWPTSWSCKFAMHQSAHDDRHASVTLSVIPKGVWLSRDPSCSSCTFTWMTTDRSLQRGIRPKLCDNWKVEKEEGVAGLRPAEAVSLLRQCVATPHEYSGCKLLQLFLSSSHGKLLSLNPPPTHANPLLWVSSSRLPLLKDDYPSAKGRRREEGISDG